MTGDPSYFRLFLRGIARVLQGAGLVALIVGFLLGGTRLLPLRPEWGGLALPLAGAAMFAAGRHLRALALRRLVPDHDD